MSVDPSTQLEQLIVRPLRRAVLAVSVVAVSSTVVYGAASTARVGRGVVTLVAEHVRAIVRGDVYAEDLLSIQKDIGRFAASLIQSHEARVRVRVWIDERLVAACGKEPLVPALVATSRRRERLASGADVRIETDVDLASHLLPFAIWIVVSSGLALAVAVLVERRVEAEIAKVVEPLGARVDWIKRLAERLAAGQLGYEALKPATIAELVELDRSVAVLMRGLDDYDGRLRHAMAENGELRARAARAELAAQVAHDLRAPVAALESLARQDLEPARSRELFRSFASRIRGIADDLLEGRRRKPASDLPARSDDQAWSLVVPVVRSVLAEKLLVHGEGGRITLDARIEAAQGARVQISPVELQRVLSNLLENAVEASAHGGRVVVELQPTDADRLRIVVADQGKGIPADVLPRLGQRGVTLGKAAGNGLGLAHARETAASHGGRLLIESEVGRGTVVTLELPRRDLRAVLVDDDVWVREAWEAAAARGGVAFAAFASGAELLAVADSLAPDTMLYLDLEIGEERGDELARELAARNFARIYFASGHQLDAASLPCGVAGAIGKEPPEWFEGASGEPACGLATALG